MIRILQATCESRLFFLYIPHPSPHPLPPSPQVLQVIDYLKHSSMPFGIFLVAFISVVYNFYLCREQYLSQSSMIFIWCSCH